jgi:hypothetical protein
MDIIVPLRDVVAAQHQRCLVRGEINNPSGPNTIGDLVMDVYTGWIMFEYEQDDPGHDHVMSFVPLGTGSGTKLDIVNYVGGVSAIVSASVSSFADAPDLAAVDKAKVLLKTHEFKGVPPARVLVLDASVAVTEGKLHRVSYQVTVLANVVPPRPPVTSSQPPVPFADLAGPVLSVDWESKFGRE